MPALLQRLSDLAEHVRILVVHLPYFYCLFYPDQGLWSLCWPVTVSFVAVYEGTFAVSSGMGVLVVAQPGWITTDTGPKGCSSPFVRKAFTLPDVLVSLAVMTVLIGLMVPALASVRAAAQRVICGSNLRQIGMGVVIYADSNRDQLPPSVMAGSVDLADIVPGDTAISLHTSLGNSIALRFDIGADDGGWWDGLGALFNAEILETPELFYCPSHKGPHTYRTFSEAWRSDDDLLVGNYQYRGGSREGVTKFSLVQPSRTALVSDSFRSMGELNHDDGFYLLRADLSISWLNESGDSLLGNVPDDLDPISELTMIDIMASSQVDESFYSDFWETLQHWNDSGRHNKPSGGGDSPGGNGKP